MIDFWFPSPSIPLACTPDCLQGCKESCQGTWLPQSGTFKLHEGLHQRKIKYAQRDGDHSKNQPPAGTLRETMVHPTESPFWNFQTSDSTSEESKQGKPQALLFLGCYSAVVHVCQPATVPSWNFNFYFYSSLKLLLTSKKMKRLEGTDVNFSVRIINFVTEHFLWYQYGFFMNCKEKQVYKNKTHIKYKLSLCKLMPAVGYHNLHIFCF